MKRFTGLLNRSKSHDGSQVGGQPAVDSPEANAGRGVRLFCESGSMSNQGEEVLHLPVIVEAAESSPQAAASAAQQIRQFLKKDNNAKPYVQYNAIMLIRILADNPGPSFTRNFDEKFVGTVKELLKTSKDTSVQQILRETLDALEADKHYDMNLQPLFLMWRKQKGMGAQLNYGQQNSRSANPPPNFRVPPYDPNASIPPSQQQSSQRVFTRNQLPPPFELSSRIEEARNTAKILLQLIQSTAPEDVMQNELIREFSERCQSAQRSMQGYINCDSPAADHDTLQTLIETNEQLSLAMSRYQRAILSARRAMGASTSPNPEAVGHEGSGAFSGPPAPGQRESLFSQSTTTNTYPPSSPPPKQAQTNGFGTSATGFGRNGYNDESYDAPSGPPPQLQKSLQDRSRRNEQVSDPFADPVEHDHNPPPLAFEPTNYGPPQGITRRDTMDLENAYSEPSSATDRDSLYTSPTVPPRPRKPVGAGHSREPSDSLYAATPTSDGIVSPASAGTVNTSNGFISPTQSEAPQQNRPGPGPGPYHYSGATPSYIGRQASAANGLTMHGAQSDDAVHEIDGHSEVGRGSNGSHSVSPVERRVDVPGTGGHTSPVDKRRSMFRY